MEQVVMFLKQVQECRSGLLRLSQWQDVHYLAY